MSRRSLAHVAVACSVAALISGVANAALLDAANPDVASSRALVNTAATDEQALVNPGATWSLESASEGTKGGALPPRAPLAAVRAIYGFPVAGFIADARVVSDVDRPSPVPLPAASWLLALGVLAASLLSRLMRGRDAPPDVKVLIGIPLGK